MVPFALLALFQAPIPPARPAPDAVLATVGGKPVTAAEIEPYLWAWKAREVVREVADARAIVEAAAAEGVTATDAEVQARVDATLATVRASLQPGQTIEQFLASRGADLSRVALSARTAVLLDKISERDFRPEGFFRTETLLFRTVGDTTDALRGAIRAADAAYAALAAGKPWAEVVRLNTEVVGALGVTTPMGWKAGEVFPESVRTALATLKPGGFTKPTQTSNGIQIYRLVLRGADAKATDLADLRRQYVEGSRGAVLTRLRGAVKVEVK